MLKITDKSYYEKILVAVEESGYQLEPAELSFELGDAVAEGFGPNPSGFYGALGVNLPKKEGKELAKSDADFHLGFNDVVVLMGSTIEDARHFSFTLYQYSYEDETFGTVTTRSSIGDCFNNVNIKSSDGRDSKNDAPFIIVIGGSPESRDAVMAILADCIDKELLISKGTINELHLPCRMASMKVKLNLLYRVSYLGQSFGAEVLEEKIKKMEEEYKNSDPFQALVVRNVEGKIHPGEDLRRYDELNQMVEKTAFNLKEILAPGYRVTEGREHQLKAPPEVARFIGLDLACNSPDALYRSIFFGGDLLKATGEIFSRRLEGRASGQLKEPITAIKLAHKFYLEDEEFLLFVGVNYTFLKRVVYFSYALYDEDYKMSMATFNDSNLLKTTEQDEIFAFVVTPDQKTSEKVVTMLKERSPLPQKVLVKALEKKDKFYLGGRLYIDRITKEQPQVRDYVPGMALLFTNK